MMEHTEKMKSTEKTNAEIMAAARGQFVVSAILKVLVWGSAVITAGVILLLVGYILITGIPNLNLGLFAWKFTTENQSMMPALVNTLCMTVITLILAVPIGIGAAIYMTEYAKRGNKLVKLVRLTAETLAGIPSIVYGLFGMMLFNVAWEWGYSMLAGCVTLAIMILPLILRTTEEAIMTVPDSYREGSFGLGAGKLRTVFKIILPPAMPGILSGIILAIGRIVGESAALIFTSGSGKENLNFVNKEGTFSLFAPLFQSTRTLSVHMYNLMSEGLYTKQAQATAVVLLMVVIGINCLSSYAAKKLGGQEKNG